MWRPQHLAEFYREGIRILTPLADGSLGAEFVLQPDGDVVNNVTRAFLSDSGAQRRHAEAIDGKLARLRRLGALTGKLTSAVVTATSASLAVLHDGLAVKLPLASFLLVLLLRVFREHRKRPDRPSRTAAIASDPAGVRVGHLLQRSHARNLITKSRATIVGERPGCEMATVSRSVKPGAPGLPARAP